jgi:predicted RNA-binding Zn-ribbon protein involved in translation (DUF1610 family)
MKRKHAIEERRADIGNATSSAYLSCGAAMFEDETIDINCPQCGHLNSILVREFEAANESHLVCIGCKAAVKIEAPEFRRRLEDVRKELEELEREAASAPPKPRPGKDDYEI